MLILVALQLLRFMAFCERKLKNGVGIRGNLMGFYTFGHKCLGALKSK